MRNRPLIRVLGAVVVLTTAPGCGLLEHASAKERAATYSHYPPGRWRLATRDELARVVLWTSHIVIMHRGSTPGMTHFYASDWKPDPQPTRTEDEAFKIAQEAHRRAAAEPDKFADLVKEYSDDAMTKSRGGSIGGVRADQLSEEFLDALATMQPGDVSNIVRTSLGFHIILRRAAPPREEISGNRVMIQYNGAWGAKSDERSLAEALKLATTVMERARAGEDFEQLVSKYSEGLDRVRRGDVGTMLTTEPELDPVTVEAIAALPIGGISEPVQTPWGFEVYRRTEVRPRMEFATRVVRIPYAADAPDSDPMSASSVREHALEIARSLRTGKTTFQSYQEMYCCKFPSRWFDGHGFEPLLSNALEPIAIGEVTPEPIQETSMFVVAQRLDPELLTPPPPVLYELPSPAGVNMEGLIRSAKSEGMVPYVRDLRAALVKWPLGNAQKKTIAGVLKEYEEGLAKDQTPEARVLRYEAALGALHRDLPEATYAHVVEAIRAWVSTKVLMPPG